MIQKIKFDELRKEQGISEIAFIRAVMACDKDFTSDNGIYDLEFSVNGHDVDFKKFCGSFEAHWDAEVKREAARQLKELISVSDIEETLESFKRVVKDKAVDILIDKFGMSGCAAADALNSSY